MTENEQLQQTKLKKLGVDKLKEVAKFLQIPLDDVDGKNATETKKNIFVVFDEFGIDDETYEKFYVEEKETVVEKPTQEIVTKEQYSAGGKTVVKLIGRNPVFEQHGFKFTRDAPFVAMSDEDAQMLIDSHDGTKFAVATPREVKEFYS